jgi:hypothetical protein
MTQCATDEYRTRYSRITRAQPSGIRSYSTQTVGSSRLRSSMAFHQKPPRRRLHEPVGVRTVLIVCYALRHAAFRAFRAISGRPKKGGDAGKGQPLRRRRSRHAAGIRVGGFVKRRAVTAAPRRWLNNAQTAATALLARVARTNILIPQSMQLPSLAGSPDCIDRRPAWPIPIGVRMEDRLQDGLQVSLDNFLSAPVRDRWNS